MVIEEETAAIPLQKENISVEVVEEVREAQLFVACYALSCAVEDAAHWPKNVTILVEMVIMDMAINNL